VITASAPGKLMLAGEYAVVGGHGPALAVALDARATVRLEPGGDGWRVSSSALGLQEASVAAVPVLAAAVTELGSRLPSGGHLVVSSELGAGSDKPGFGSSAAVGVAGLGALRSFAGLGAPSLEEAVRVHRAGQAGRGSGYDVATALYGGLCAFENAPSGVAARSAAWLEGLHAAVLFTGRGARTTDHLARLEAATAAGTSQALLEALGRRASDLLAAWERGVVAGVLACAEAAERALVDLDAACDLGIRGGGVGELRQAIASTGVVARTSGAGGGDCVWALASSGASLAQAVEAAEAVGCRRLGVGWPGLGLEVSE